MIDKGRMKNAPELALAKDSSSPCNSDRFEMCRSWALAVLCDDMTEVQDHCCASCTKYGISHGIKRATPV